MFFSVWEAGIAYRIVLPVGTDDACDDTNTDKQTRVEYRDGRGKSGKRPLTGRVIERAL